MNSGIALSELATTLEAQKASRKDYVAPNDAYMMEVQEDGRATLGFIDPSQEGLQDAPIRPYAHWQIGDYLDIPKSYYDRMLAEKPHLLADNVNAWLHNGKSAERRMLRTLGGEVRAVLSPRYRRLENVDLAEAVLPVLGEYKATIESSQLTETKMYIKAQLPALQAEVKGSRQVGDIVSAGIVISNSEVGAGAIRVEPMLYRLVCKNGMISADMSLRKFHLGRDFGGDADGTWEVLTDATQALDDVAFWAKIVDITRAAFDERIFRGIVAKMSEATEQRIDSDNLQKVVEVTTRQLALPDTTRPSILRSLIEGADLSRWGLLNAVTAAANTAPDYELSTQLERAGGKILELPASEWRVIAHAE